MKSICVFCGSTPGSNPSFLLTARALGRTLAEKKIKLIYGGARVGLMGAVADNVLAHGGTVTGVLPRFLQTKEVAHTSLTEMILVDTMHERKMKMFELSEGFIALPGGFGTLEEVIEILTWAQLGLHKFPVGFLNVSNYYAHLRLLFDEMEKGQLLKPEHKTMAIFNETIDDLLAEMRAYHAPAQAKVMPKSST